MWDTLIFVAKPKTRTCLGIGSIFQMEADMFHGLDILDCSFNNFNSMWYRRLKKNLNIFFDLISIFKMTQLD